MYTLWLTIWKHFISEIGQWLFPSFSLETTKLYIVYFTFKRKEENIQAHIYTVFLLRATTAHGVFMLAMITTQHMNTELALCHEHRWIWWFGIRGSPLLSLTSKSFLETNPTTHICQYTAMQPHQVNTYCTPVHQQLTYPCGTLPLTHSREPISTSRAQPSLFFFF